MNVNLKASWWIHEMSQWELWQLSRLVTYTFFTLYGFAYTIYFVWKFNSFTIIISLSSSLNIFFVFAGLLQVLWWQTRKKCRQYDLDYLKFEFIQSLSNQHLSMCLICDKVFSKTSCSLQKWRITYQEDKQIYFSPLHAF